MTKVSKQDSLNHDHRRARRPTTNLAFRRSRQGFIAGIAGGIAHFTNTNPLYVRLLLVLALVMTVGVASLPYLLLWWLIPLEN